LEAGLSRSMKNSNLINYILSESGPLGLEEFLHAEGDKQAEEWENLLMVIVHSDLAQQKCDYSALC
jgi:hypothetical protein